jgi:hypothetical protein
MRLLIYLLVICTSCQNLNNDRTDEYLSSAVEGALIDCIIQVQLSDPMNIPTMTRIDSSKGGYFIYSKYERLDVGVFIDSTLNENYDLDNFLMDTLQFLATPIEYSFVKIQQIPKEIIGRKRLFIVHSLLLKEDESIIIKLSYIKHHLNSEKLEIHLKEENGFWEIAKRKVLGIG